MREIKFRGRDKDGNWHYGLLHYSHGHGTFSITKSNGWSPSYNNPDEGESTLFVGVDYKTVGQFTGLKDKNGKEIYEGDILECSWLSFDPPNKRKSFSRVEYIVDGFFGDNKRLSDAIMSLDKREVIYKVASNIHDNPELLNK